MQAVPDTHQLAFGETIGFDVPTRYPPTTHHVINAMMAADSSITPVLFRMSHRTRRASRILAGLLMTGRNVHTDVDLRWQLQFEIAAGIICLLAAVFGRVRFFERLYLFVGAIMLIGNAIMTQVSD